ncbi:MAG: hypothetical protein QXM75_01635 [Candidatus Diapherotrites archaeon]
MEPLFFALIAAIKLGVFLVALFHSVIVARFAKLKELEILISVSLIYVFISAIELAYIYQYVGELRSSMPYEFVLYSSLFLEVLAAFGIMLTLLWINKDIKKWK